jgi:hypothetical protein
MKLITKVIIISSIATTANLIFSLLTQAQVINLNDSSEIVYPFDQNVLLTSQSLQGVESKSAADWLWASNQNARETIELNLSQANDIESLIIKGSNFPINEFFSDNDSDSGRIKLIEF